MRPSPENSAEYPASIPEEKKRPNIRYDATRQFGRAARMAAVLAFGLQSCQGITPREPTGDDIAGTSSENLPPITLTVDLPTMTPSEPAPSATPTITETVYPTQTPAATRTPRPSPTQTAAETETQLPTHTTTGKIIRTATPTEISAATETAGEAILINRTEGSRGVAEAFINFRNELQKYMTEHDGAYPTDRIPQYVFRRDDDPATKRTEAFDAGIVWMDQAGFKRVYGDKRGVKPENLSDCLELAFRPFLADWEDLDFWSFGPNSIRVLNTYTSDCDKPPVKKCGWQRDEINADDRTYFHSLGIDQKIIK